MEFDKNFWIDLEAVQRMDPFPLESEGQLLHIRELKFLPSAPVKDNISYLILSAMHTGPVQSNIFRLSFI